MKHIYLAFLCIVSIGNAQIPSNYYDSANGLSGYALKTELKNILSNGHVDQGYNTLFTGYISTHSDNVVESGYENDGTILLYYGENPNGVDSYSYTHGSSNQCGSISAEGDCYNRESIVPQGSFSAALPMKNDIHHVVPTDGYVNSQRGNLPFGTVGTATWTSLSGCKKGNSTLSNYSGEVFEPIDEFKGDIARAILYFATRYEDTVDSYTSFVMFNGTEDQVLHTWALAVLLDWHNNIDPVDQREIDRNNAAYNYQGNANPFVDHPEYADAIWANALSIEENIASEISIHPNPVKDNLTIKLSSNSDTNIEIYDILGKRVYQNTISKTSTLNIQDLKTGIYVIKMTQHNKTITKKLVKQ
ncbi:endonuclease [Winogradskyella eckloniae]|uniref:endonuclease n=1 Tax=Winogradskyella eckloniae TaxID=1089306 RepID=UPI001566AC25|nr:endonuclease [Winogradskyella eckloniae]NRD19727.1 endonuclease [Winogradskyella eckloniae]